MSLRQVSKIEAMAATSGPACSLSICNQFLRLCGAPHNRKNFMFFGSEEAGQGNAVVYTLIANCRLHGVEPCEYLKDVLTRLPYMSNSQVPELTPLRWKANREKTARQAA